MPRKIGMPTGMQHVLAYTCSCIRWTRLYSVEWLRGKRRERACSSGTATNWRDMRSSDQNWGSSTVSRARSQMMPSHSTRARHFFGFPGRRTCTVVAFMICAAQGFVVTPSCPELAVLPHYGMSRMLHNVF